MLDRPLAAGLPEGGVIELESPRSMGQYERMNDGFYAALGLAVSS